MFTTGEVAARLGLVPRQISYLFDRRRLDVSRCPVVSGRRLIPEDYLPTVEREVKRSKWKGAA